MKIATKTQTADSVVFKFANGETVKCDVTDLPREMLVRLAVHGMAQKGGDSYAGANDNGWSVADCADSVRGIWSNLKAGVWSAAREAGVSINAEALAALTGKSVDDAVEVIAGMTADQVKELVKRPDMKAEIAKIRAERAAARAAAATGGDADDLGELFNK